MDTISFTDKDGTRVSADITTWVVSLFSVLDQKQKDLLRARLRARQDRIMAEERVNRPERET